MPTFFSLAEVLEMAITLEKKGRVYYENIASRTKDSEMRELFLFLAREEMRHEERFKALAEKVKASPESLPAKWEEVRPYLQVITDSRFFAGEDKAIRKQESAEAVSEIFEYAIRFEKDTILFYQEIRGLVSVSDQKVVEEIIEEEKSHIRRLADFSLKY
jgi:rubrerythrin